MTTLSDKGCGKEIRTLDNTKIVKCGEYNKVDDYIYKCKKCRWTKDEVKG